MKLIVGLGNPGKEYSNTRHNVGFMVIDKYVHEKRLNQKEKMNGIFSEEIKNGEKFIYLKPQTYINLSGQVISQFMNFYKIDVEDILIIHDDLDTSIGKMKIRLSGGSAGHNGLKNIESCIGTKNYKRIKIGISNNKNIDTKNYVLGKFSKDETILINDDLDKAYNILNDFGSITPENLMNKYN
ncbi:MAG: aminoacyl-tRNA hydrolase [Bacilli bacterium]